MMRWHLLLVLLMVASPAFAHGLGTSGLLHPLTGLDHMLAMLAVGAWSAQLGGRHIIRIPLAFLLAMVVGAVYGLYGPPMSYTDFGTAVSVVFLGLAIALRSSLSFPLAAAAIGMFGFCHGYAHGKEIGCQPHVASYILGFLTTTVLLHVVGAVGGLLLLEQKAGGRTLRVLGVAITMIGCCLWL